MNTADAATPSTTLPTAVIHADVYAEHDTGVGHPECPMRYQTVVNALRQSDAADALLWLGPRDAQRDEILLGHTEDYVDIVERDIQMGLTQLSTGDTAICADSWQPAVQAAGGAFVAVDSVMQGKAKNAFCAARPPGHHASPNRGMGFCVFNNIALAARYAQERHEIGKVLIVDWDVHHGNGTQDAFYGDDSVLFFSTHQHPWYPGTGRRDETGEGRGLGTNMNHPFTFGAGRSEILGAFETQLVDAARKFQPELVLISAGFDSRHDDPLGGFLLTDDDFADLTTLILDLADELADGRVVSLLEGGYNLDGLGKAVTAHCSRLAKHQKKAG